MKMRLVAFFDRNREAGYVMEIDRIRFQQNCSSGVMVRVINEWSRPAWLDLGWFVDKSKAGTKILEEK
jgi:hypothetical protein